METEYKGKIYDRLLEIKFQIDISAIPEPQQVNEKIGQCHAYIEEIEYFSIRIHKELSVMQQAYNNSLAEFELKKDTLLTQEPIRSLPNIRDREAQANLLLRADQEKTQNYQNELNDLNNLLKAVTLKAKNLNRANGDIRLQLRVLEAQIRLGSGHATSAAAKGLMEEMNKSSMDEDSFKEAISEATEEKVADPSVSINMEEIFTEEEPEKEGLAESLIEPVPEFSSENDGEEGSEDLPVEYEVDKETELEIEKSIVEDKKPNGIDLDTIINLDEKGGSKPEKEKEEPKKEKTDVKQKSENKDVNQKKEDHQKSDDGIDIDDLLDNYS